MICGGIRDHLEGDTTPLAGISSSPARYPRMLLVFFYIKIPAKSIMLWIIGYKRYKKMRSQRTSRGVIKVWRQIKF